MKNTIDAAGEAATASKSTRTAPKPPTRYQVVQSASGKPTRGLPFGIVSPMSGKPIVEGHLVIVPDDAVNVPTKPFLPGMPAPTVLRRRQMACLLRAWRNDPDTTLEERNMPTAGDLMGMIIRNSFDAALGQAFNPTLA
jgi:hypothetical protein